MNQETKLKLQAYVDRELSETESQEMAAWLDRDSEARALVDELNEVNRLLENNELEVRVPESREFYWSKIERVIRPMAADTPDAEPAVARGHAWWLRLFAPALGVAVLLMTTLTLVRQGQSPPPTTYPHQIETPLEDTSTLSFYSPSAGMTVVWVQSDIY